MRVHITNLYGYYKTSIARRAQNRVAKVAAETLGFNELGIYAYDMETDSPQMLATRLDGIVASVENGDVVFLQFPTWNDFEFDEVLLNRLTRFIGLKKIAFVHDVPSLMFEANRYMLRRHIDLLNRTDLVILPSQNMADFLRSEGLTVKKTVIQKMWDFPVTVDWSVRPKFERVMNFAGKANTDKFNFVKDWSYDTVELRITGQKESWGEGKNVGFLGWFNEDTFLVNALKHSGGFGLLWSEDPYFSEYMKLNASYKLSTYLAAGLPVIVKNTIAERDTIVRKNLGLAVDSLDEAVEKVCAMSQEEYDKMVDALNEFSNLVRDNYFVKKVLIDAVFKLLYE